MRIDKIEIQERFVLGIWSDGSIRKYPYIWLRDNDPDELHPATKERTFDLTSVDLSISPCNIRLEKDCLAMRWPTRDSDSYYSFEWLNKHRLGAHRADPAAMHRQSWDASTLSEPPRFDARECQTSPNSLVSLLKAMRNTGIAIVEGLDDNPKAGEAFADRIGFKRETNFGVVFEVKSKADPNNLAYTSHALPLHTDLANQELVPGFQFLHCYRNEAAGGASVFSDGLSAVESLRQERPDLFETLSRIEIPWRFHDEHCDLRQRRPVITLNRKGVFKSLTLNPHLADVPDLDTDKIYPFYEAYQELMRRTRVPQRVINYCLSRGEMVVFDNLRILHGRTEFDPNSGDRHLRGFYIEHNEVESCMRMLAKI